MKGYYVKTKKQKRAFISKLHFPFSSEIHRENNDD